MFKVNNIGKETSSVTSLCCFYREVGKDFAHCLGVSIVDFEKMGCFITISVESKITFSLNVFEKLFRKKLIVHACFTASKIGESSLGRKGTKQENTYSESTIEILENVMKLIRS